MLIDNRDPFSISTYLLLGYSKSIDQFDISLVVNVLAMNYLYLIP